jgi:aminocarboxymuconate-semialdehyde decarboxylase
MTLRINVHSHVVPPSIMGKAGPHGPELKYLGGGRAQIRAGKHTLDFSTLAAQQSDDPEKTFAHDQAVMNDPVLRLKEMDQLGIDIMGVCGAPVLYMYWAEPEIAIPFVRAYNEALADYCTVAPHRLFFVPTIPAQDVTASVKEIDYAVGELGGRGVNLGAQSLGGRNIDDPELWPIFAAAQEHDVPLFIHPEPTGFAEQRETTDPYYLSLIVDFLAQETTAFVRLVLGGVLDEFPRLKVYITHAGGFVPFQLGRIERFAAIAADARAQRPVKDYLSNFYFDVLVHDVTARRFLLDVMGEDNLLVGDNFKGMDSADGFAFVDEMGLDPAIATKINETNAVRAFGLESIVAAYRKAVG